MPATPIVGNEVIFSTDPLAVGPHVTALSDDTFTLSWESVTGDLFGRHLDATGNFTSGNFLAGVKLAPFTFTNPLVVQESSGAIVTEFGVQETPDSQAIGEHFVDPSFQPTFGVSIPRASSQSQNLVDAVPTFQGVAVAYDTEDNNHNFHTAVRFLTPDGVPINPDISVGADGESGTQDDAVLLSTGVDSVDVAYTHVDPTTGDRDIRFQTILANGVKSDPIGVSGPGTNADFANMTKLADGSVVIVWQDSQGIEIKRLLPSGLTQGFGHVPDSQGGFLPKVTALKDGSFIVAWTAGSGVESDGSPNEDIFLRHFVIDTNLNPVNPLFTSGTLIHLAEPGDQGLFQMDMTELADGRVLLTYASETGDATNVNNLVYRIIDPRDPNLAGTASNDVIVGTPVASTINGLGGDDKLIGQAGDDVLNGGDGNDTLDGGLGNDILDGGAGIDTASFASNPEGVAVNLIKGTATGQGNDKLLNIENATGSNGNDVFIGNAGDNVLDGGAGIDTVRFDSIAAAVTVDLSHNTATGQGHDTLLNIENVDGSNLNDSITGDNGNNVIDGRGGTDIMKGLGGNDTYFVDNPGDVVIEAVGGGNDKVVTSVSYTLQAGQEIETLQTINKSATTAINLTGNEFSQTIIGNAGPNFIAGGGGNDTLTGGGGADTFLFNTALDAKLNVDKITDFDVSQDLIALDHTIFKGLALGSLAPGAFFVGSAAHDSSDRIIYNPSTGALTYDSNGSAAGGATQFATLSHNLALTAGDFKVV